MSKQYILFNPMAGKGEAKEVAEALSVSLPSAEIVDITEIKSYTDFFEELGAEDTITLCGGDGTVNRFVNDTRGISKGNDIYFCPVGSGNDLLRDLPQDIEENGRYKINIYLEKLPKVTVGNDTYEFINGIGFGIDGYCCEKGDELKKKTGKKINYTSIAIKGLLYGFKPVNATVTVDGETHTYKKVWLAPTMNGRFYGGGMMPTPGQDRLSIDGRLSLLVFFGSGKLRTLMAFPGLFTGEHVKHPEAEILTGYDITVEFDRESALQIDGETISGVKKYRATSSRKV